MKNFIFFISFSFLFSCQEVKRESTENCKYSLNENTFLVMSYSVIDNGFIDMTFSREIHIVREKDSIKIPLSDSQYKNFYVKYLDVKDLGLNPESKVLFYNQDNNSYAVVDFINFNLIESSNGNQVKQNDLPHNKKGNRLLTVFECEAN